MSCTCSQYEVEIETFLEAYKSKIFDFLFVFCHKASVLLTKIGNLEIGPRCSPGLSQKFEITMA